MILILQMYVTHLLVMLLRTVNSVDCLFACRRMSHLSIDTLLEMIKGDAGELPVGREIIGHGKQCSHMHV